MNVINELESRATTRDKEEFLNKLHDELLTDLWLIYGRIGTASRAEKIAIICRSEKTRDEKIHHLKKFLACTKRAKNLFSALGDKEEVAKEARTLKRLKSWKRYFENEAQN